MSRDTPIRSRISRSTATTVTIKGHDLCTDLMGKASLGDMAFLGMLDRLPDAGESVMFNAMMVALVEHGITPSSLAARLTYAGAPEAMQAAIGAGLAGLGSNYVGSMENAARLLQEHGAQSDVEPEAIARAIYDACRADKKHVPGLGHGIHKPVDPRAERLMALAAEHGFAGRYTSAMETLARIASEESGKPLPMNATGAIAAIASEMGIDWRIIRGLGVAARAVGLVAHIKEEIENPIAIAIKKKVQAEAEGDD